MRSNARAAVVLGVSVVMLAVLGVDGLSQARRASARTDQCMATSRELSEAQDRLIAAQDRELVALRETIRIYRERYGR